MPEIKIHTDYLEVIYPENKFMNLILTKLKLLDLIMQRNSQNISVVRVIKIDSLDLEVMKKSDQEEFLLKFRNSLNSVGFDFQLCFIARKKDFREYMEELETKRTNKNDRYYTHLQSFFSANNLLSYELYIVVQESSLKPKISQQKLTRKTNKLIQIFNNLYLHPRTLGKQELQKYLNYYNEIQTFKT